MINRLILWLALAGVVLALHLWVQKARNFDQGCLGLDSHAPAVQTEAGCQEVGLLPASHLLGVSNAAWGYAFYFGLAVLSFAKLVVQPRMARRCHRVSEIAVALALIYTVYLVYHMAAARTWCMLCLGSAGLIVALAALHLGLRLRGGYTPVEEPARTEEFRVGVGALFAAVGVLAGVLMFVDRLGTRSLNQGSTRRELIDLVGAALPQYIDGEKLLEMRACHFDWEAPELPPGQFTRPTTPYLGKADGPEVVIFYDPNCPHCRSYQAVFQRLIGKYRDRARFTIAPRMLWRESLTQIEALKLAESSGKYFDVWRLMFERQPGPHKSMSVAEIAGLFSELGLDTSDLAKRLAAARPAVEEAHERTLAAGIDFVPMIFIDGRRVWGSNHTEACVGKLVERVLANTATPR